MEDASMELDLDKHQSRPCFVDGGILNVVMPDGRQRAIITAVVAADPVNHHRSMALKTTTIPKVPVCPRGSPQHDV